MLVTVTVLSLPLLSYAYSWNFEAAPKQCSDLTVSVSGNDGRPPYTVMIIPSGSTPFNVEVRRLLFEQFADNSTRHTFRLPYPANSQLVAVVGDASGFASGGASVAALVTNSDDTSCFSPTEAVKGPWEFSLFPPSQFTMCQDSRIAWNPPEVQGTPKFLGVIPGGQSFAIPTSRITDRTNDGQLAAGFNWNANLRAGTFFHFIAGDNRSPVSGGSVGYTVANGPQNDFSCLNNTSPSSTAGDPAGGTYPTSTDGGTSNGDSLGNTSKNNTGAIVGGVIGGLTLLTAIILAIYFLRRKRRNERAAREKPDLLTSDEGDETPDRPQELPQYYQPEPFMVPMPTSATATDGGFDEDYRTRRSSMLSVPRSETPSSMVVSSMGMSAATRKGGPPRSFRPVNIVQHDDAGPSYPQGNDEAETIELPPAYTNIKSAGPVTPSEGPAAPTTSAPSGPPTTQA